MLISREVIVKRATRDEQTDTDTSASVIAAARAIHGLTDSDVHTLNGYIYNFLLLIRRYEQRHTALRPPVP